MLRWYKRFECPSPWNAQRTFVVETDEAKLSSLYLYRNFKVWCDLPRAHGELDNVSGCRRHAIYFGRYGLPLFARVHTEQQRSALVAYAIANKLAAYTRHDEYREFRTLFQERTRVDSSSINGFIEDGDLLPSLKTFILFALIFRVFQRGRNKLWGSGRWRGNEWAPEREGDGKYFSRLCGNIDDPRIM